jgi:hypothetical protein
MTDYKRHGKRWTTSEILNLQREYQLLNWSVYQIAEKHQRSIHSIHFYPFCVVIEKHAVQPESFDVHYQGTSWQPFFD